MDDQAPMRGDPNLFYGLLGRALTEDSFREALKGGAEEQAAALRSVGIEPTEEVIKALNESIEAIGRLASAGAFGLIPYVT